MPGIGSSSRFFNSQMQIGVVTGDALPLADIPEVYPAPIDQFLSRITLDVSLEVGCRFLLNLLSNRTDVGEQFDLGEASEVGDGFAYHAGPRG